ncbi:MAG TPA: hypothetical protein ENK57_02920 [Polyangiaceae bacterium]|nr:hypothetical protein [Polyangiaceae bacterium]
MPTNKPTWGDDVWVKTDAPELFRPGSLAAVCGLRVLECPLEAKAAGYAAGTTLYLIEYGDGSAVEAPGEWLVVVPDDP